MPDTRAKGLSELYALADEFEADRDWRISDSAMRVLAEWYGSLNYELKGILCAESMNGEAQIVARSRMRMLFKDLREHADSQRDEVINRAGPLEIGPSLIISVISRQGASEKCPWWPM